MGLKEYKAKRDFARTTEPSGKRAAPPGVVLQFVVQKHDATRLHYDFRLEMEGVLKSWAVPKGFPHELGDRRLAVEVEDHPIQYGSFEGTIPEGNYGAGTVMLWDRGTYRVSGDNPVAALKAGKLHLFLKGHKLKGEWTLVRMRRESGGKPQWLLLKSGRGTKPVSRTAEDRSVLSGRSLATIARVGEREWKSDRSVQQDQVVEEAPRSKQVRQRAVGGKAVRQGATPGAELAGCPRRDPAFVEPMKALLSESLPRGPDWVYEIKFDGVRALAIKRGTSVRLISRTGKELNYPAVKEGIAGLRVEKAVLDGEVVALDEAGRSSFQLLQSWHQSSGARPPLVYYVFDLLNLEGNDLRLLPLERRKQMARALTQDAGTEIRFSAAFETGPEQLMLELKARGLEGLIAKRKDSPYQAGKRSGLWVKYKWRAEQEFVIGGYTLPQGGRSYFGAILVGYYEARKLLYAGKVGTGFDEEMLKALHRRFQRLIIPDCPFANLPEKRTGAYGRGMTGGQMRRCTWLKPELVCQVKFSEWTRDNILRQPAFTGLREDKPAQEVAREVDEADYGAEKRA